MHKDLVKAYESLVEILKDDSRCLGGWHFGSVARNEQDIYSDYDLVFLIESSSFIDFAREIKSMLQRVSDEVLIFWAEDFNDDLFRNYCAVLKIGETLHQLDVFIVNDESAENWMTRLHSQGFTSEHIIFDRDESVKDFMAKIVPLDYEKPSLERIIDTYWFHAEMLVKYFKRRDFFKLVKNIEVLFQSHVELLVYQYNNIGFAPWESIVKSCVPQEKQENLKLYFTEPDIDKMEEGIRKCMNVFEDNAAETCKQAGVNYPKDVSKKVIADFDVKMK